MIKKALAGICRKIVDSYYGMITCIEMIIFITMFFVILDTEPVNYIFEKEEIILNTDGVEKQENIIENIGEGNHYFVTPTISLGKGIYNIHVIYRAEGDNHNCDILSTSAGAYSRYSDYVTVYSYNTECEYDFWVNDKLDTMNVKIGYANNGRLEIERVEIKTAWNSVLYNIFKMTMTLIIVNVVCYLWIYRERLKADKVVVVGLLGITLMASTGLMGEYYQWGHDLDFHMLRIEGLKDGILSGAFPVRIQPNWVNGWGYPVSVMYGDLTLIVPALLRIIGVPVQDAYKWFVVLVNFGTALSSYICFKKISKNKYIGLTVSLLYTLSVYRMCCLYIRAAVGEYTAMMFLPMVVLCFYHALAENTEDSDYGKNLWIPVLGFTGLLQTHILTCQMAAIFIVLLCVFTYKKIFVKKTFIYLSKVAGISIFINLWFIVPLIQYMGEELNVMAAEFDGKIQRIGITLMELFAPIYNGTFGTHWNEIVSISGKFPISLGSSFLIVMAVFLIFCGDWKTLNNKRASAMVFGLAVLSIYMATNLFPYNAIFTFNEGLGGLIAKGKLPYRYLSISGILCGMLTCLLLVELKDRWKKEYVRAFAGALCVIAALQGTSYIYQVLLHNGASIKYDDIALNTGNLMGDEYLYVGSNTWTPFQDNQVHGNGAEIISWEKEYNRVQVSAKSIEENATVTVPLFYYPGYEARDTKNDSVLELVRSQDNNRIEICLPSGYEGSFEVKFVGKLLWHIAGIVSLIATVCFMCVQMNKKGVGKVGNNLKSLVMHVKERGNNLKQEYLKEKISREETKRNRNKAGNSVGELLRSPMPGIMVISIGMFVIMLMLNFHTEFTSDDFKYHFFFDTIGNPTAATHRMKLWEIIPSMINHRQIWNGRIVSHGLLQLALMLGKTGFKILNAIMYIVLGTLIYEHITYGRKKSVSILAFVYVCMWFFLPQFGLTVLWASGTANYLWNTVIILGFVLVYRIYLFDSSKLKDNKKNTALILVLGMLAGCTNENTGGAAVLLAIMFSVAFAVRKIKVPNWAYAGIVGSVLGVVILVFAPANRRVSSQTDIQGLWNRFVEIMQISQRELTYLIVIICVLAVISVALGREGKERDGILPLTYFMAGAASICVLCFSAMYPERAWFVGTTLFIVVAGCFFQGLHRMPKSLHGVVTVLLLVVFLCSFRKEYAVVEQTYSQVKEGIDIIEDALEKGETSVTIPMVTWSANKYDPFNGTGYVKESADDWLNAWMAEYYGLEAIYGYEKIQ